MPGTADVFVEVTALDAVHQAATAWFRSEGVEPSPRLSDITDTHWKARQFTVEPEAGHAFTFWAWTDPARGKPVAVEGDLSAKGMRFAIVVARWNAVITERLLEGALDALLRSGAKRADIEIARVPGAWEIPSAARTFADQAAHNSGPARRLDAIITLGCLLRGETAHYEAIYNEVARGIGQSQQETGIPHSFGVLTCETLEQALNRAGIKAGNKGFEAALAAIEMVSLRRKMLEGGAA
jgi:6,7-dimethyl-8-ribityllumazine synthase